MQYPVKILLVFGLLIAATPGKIFGQFIKFRTTSVTYLEKNYDGSWGQWSPHKKIDIMITHDVLNQKITVYSDPLMIYDIARQEEKKYDEDGGEVFSFLCVGQDGTRCYIHHLFLNDKENHQQLYIEYDDFITAYDIHYIN